MLNPLVRDYLFFFGASNLSDNYNPIEMASPCKAVQVSTVSLD